MLDGKEISFDVPPQIINGRTMVPIRAVFEALGATLEWNAATRTAKATIDDYVVECTIDSKTMTACGEKIEMDVAPVIVDGRTLVPVRAIFEALGATVSWDDATKCATGIKDGNEIQIREYIGKMYKNLIESSRNSTDWETALYNWLDTYKNT